MLKYFLEALCGQEEPLLAFKGGKYISVATAPSNHSQDTRSRQDSLTEKEVTVFCLVYPLITFRLLLAPSDLFITDVTPFLKNTEIKEAVESSESQISENVSHLCVCLIDRLMMS